jgi:hypothetical protein
MFYMLPCAGSEPETLLRALLAIYSQREPTHPVVVETARQIQAVYEQGFGSVTLDFSESRLAGVRPQPNIRFTYPRGT